MECKSLGVPYSMKYIAIIYVIYQKEKVQYFNDKKCYYIGENKEGAIGKLGINYTQ